MLAQSKQPLIVKFTGISKKKNLGKTEISRENDSENTKRFLGPRLLGPRVSVAAVPVFIAVCAVCAAATAGVFKSPTVEKPIFARF